MRSDRAAAQLSRAADALRSSGPGRFLTIVGCLVLLSQLAAAALTYLPSATPDPAVALLARGAPIAPTAVTALWILSNLGLAALAVVVTARALATPGAFGLSVIHQAPRAAAAVSVGVLCALAFVPLVWGLVTARPVGVVLVLSALTLLALARGQDRRGGAFLALLALVSPQAALGPIAFLLAQRRWNALGAALVGGLAVGAAGLLLLLAAGVPLALDAGPLHAGFTRGAAAGRVDWGSWTSRIPGLSRRGVAGLTLALAAATLALVAVAWRDRVRSGRAFARAYLCFTAAGLLCAFHSAYHDVIILLPATMAAIGLDRATVSRAVASALSAASAPRRPLGARARPPARRWPGRVRISRWPGLMLAAGMLLMLVPSVAWVLSGPYALRLVEMWALLAGPALVLLVASSLPPSVADDLRPIFGARGGVKSAEGRP